VALGILDFVVSYVISYRLREKKKAGLLGRKPSRRTSQRRWESTRERQTRTSVNRGHLTSVFPTSCFGLDSTGRS